MVIDDYNSNDFHLLINSDDWSINDRSIDKLAPENQSFIFNLLLTNNQDILLIRITRKI